MLIFVVARTRLDRYEELLRQFEDGRDVRIILDRREGERRLPQSAFAGKDRRRTERRWVDSENDPAAQPVSQSLWSVGSSLAATSSIMASASF